jgi:hypothetical protein
MTPPDPASFIVTYPRLQAQRLYPPYERPADSRQTHAITYYTVNMH